jgi:four helix bundle protein
MSPENTLENTLEKTQEKPLLTHEVKDAYKGSLAFAALAADLSRRCPRGHSHLASQLRRAAMMMPMRVAEAHGHRGRSDRFRKLDKARACAHESAALMDVARTLEVIADRDWRRGKALLHGIAGRLGN